MKVEVTGGAHMVVKVAAMLKAGMPVDDVVEQTGLSKRFVRRVRGAAGIPVNFGRPGKLTPEQDEDLKSIVTKKVPAEVGLSGERWSAYMVQLLIQSRYGVKVSLDWVYDMRARFGMPKDTRLGRPTKLISDMRDIAQQMKEVL